MRRGPGWLPIVADICHRIFEDENRRSIPFILSTEVSLSATTSIVISADSASYLETAVSIKCTSTASLDPATFAVHKKRAIGSTIKSGKNPPTSREGTPLSLLTGSSIV